jgi:hypothetical protein
VAYTIRSEDHQTKTEMVGVMQLFSVVDQVLLPASQVEPRYSRASTIRPPLLKVPWHEVVIIVPTLMSAVTNVCAKIQASRTNQELHFSSRQDLTMSAAAVSNTARSIVKGSKHWPHKSPALSVSWIAKRESLERNGQRRLGARLSMTARVTMGNKSASLYPQ